jgi:hypothetical protein
VNPSNLSNDIDPIFTAEFHKNLKILSQDLYTRETSTEYQNAIITSNSNSDNKRHDDDTIRAPATIKIYPSSAGDISGTYFDPKNMQERLEKYAKECGLSNESLNRYIEEAKVRAGDELPSST